MLDIRTLLFVLAVGTFLGGLTLAALARDRREPGLRTLAGACLSMSAGNVLLALPLGLPAAAALPLGNTLVVLAGCLSFEGFRRLFHRPPRGRWIAPLTAASFLTFLAFTVIWPDTRARVLVICTLLLTMRVATTWVVFSREESSFAVPARVIWISHAVMAVIASLRLTPAGVIDNLYQANLFTALGLTGTFVGFLAWVLATLVLLSRRQVAAIEESNLELAKARRSTSDFLSSFSHDIRTPLQAVVGLAQLASIERGNPEVFPKLVDRLVGSAEVLAALVGGVLDLSQIERGSLSRTTEAFRLSQLLESIHSTLAFEAERKGIGLELDIDDELDGWHEGDATGLRHILVNLVANAVHYTDEGSVVIRASAWSSEPSSIVRFAVEDTGPGITPDEFHRLSTPWTRGERAQNGTGLGLGLAIATQLTRSLGGELLCQARSDGRRGTVLVVEVPLRHRTRFAKPASKDESTITPSRPRRVLIVDDEEVNRLILGGFVQSWGAEVLSLPSGEAAVETLRDDSDFSVVLMDVRLPGMDGYEASRRIRALESSGCKVPIIGVTASALAEDRAKGLEAGMDDFLTKPVEQGVLRAALARYVKLEEQPPPRAEVR